jgi:hypothetical protein
MPIDYKRYPSGWKKMSLTIRRIAGNCCEKCGVPNGVPLPSGRNGKVVLTVAHIGTPLATGDGWKAGDPHDKHDVRRDNLRAWCQRCHLLYDLEDHVQHAKETRQRKRREQIEVSGQMSLFDEVRV